MRVISGKLGSRIFESPNTRKTHPMSDKMRGALFNVLGNIDDMTVLDAFAGSGSLAIEAVSRGASEVIAIDNDVNAQRTLMSNVRNLGLSSEVRIIKSSTNAWLKTNGEAKFDIILCDPPYDDLQLDLLDNLKQVLGEYGTYVLSWPSGTDLPTLSSLELVQKRNYGDSMLAFYQRIG